MHKRNGTDSGRLSTSVTLYDIDSPTISVRIIELATPADWLIAGIAHATATEASGCRDGNDYLRPQRRMSGPSSPPRLTLGQIATRRVTHTWIKRVCTRVLWNSFINNMILQSITRRHQQA